MDILLTLLLAALLVLPLMVLLIIMLFTQGRPLFYVSERMKTMDQPFALWKLRTMTVVPGECSVAGGDKAARITRLGRFIRRTRLDEVPQLWNVLKGDMTLVGPRPPLRDYTERFPEVYRDVLQSRPGLTGLASLRFHRREESLLAVCHSPAETDAVYARRCIPAKARLDLI
jgi:lipopolysaccharide/colanic/teichoic acid biosynthesis glycosyltransferase